MEGIWGVGGGGGDEAPIIYCGTEAYTRNIIYDYTTLFTVSGQSRLYANKIYPTRYDFRLLRAGRENVGFGFRYRAKRTTYAVINEL